MECTFHNAVFLSTYTALFRGQKVAWKYVVVVVLVGYSKQFSLHMQDDENKFLFDINTLSALDQYPFSLPLLSWCSFIRQISWSMSNGKLYSYK